jgi:hypothetical protein
LELIQNQKNYKQSDENKQQIKEMLAEPDGIAEEGE